MSQEPEQSAESAQPPANDHAKAISAAAANLQKFADAHGGVQSVHVDRISSIRTRIVLVAGDGRWGDQVLPSDEAAQAVVAECGFSTEEPGAWSREAVGSVTTTAYEWGRMGSGRAAGQ